eukprot:m.45877 g.45877  ORF g.45877 m.45877 type:complete len:532 (+) comp10700_c0_seq1:448-2043(+)
MTLLVQFENQFATDVTPRVEVTNIMMDGESVDLEVFPTIPIVEPTHFVIDLISIVNLDGILMVEWAASYQGACTAHNQCPDSQYCDVYRGCDDCVICVAISDTFDGEECPQKCLNLQPTTSPTTSTFTEEDGSGFSGSGEDYLMPTTNPTTTTEINNNNDSPTAVHDFPNPCIECALEEYPCGSACLPVTGYILPDCFAAAGCAVSLGRGSRSLFSSVEDIFSLPVRNVTLTKADEALNRVGDIDPHLAGNDLREILTITEETATCIEAECPVETQCFHASVCSKGICNEQEPKEQGIPCDDGVEATDEDMCDGMGQCFGVDFCENVTCEALSQCHTVGTCSHGICSNPPQEQGVACDDGNDRTTSDVCNGEGVCEGVDLCDGIECPAPSQCFEEGTCFRGQCSFDFKPAATPCDDGVEATDEDACDGEGICMGVDYCEGVECAPVSQCHLPGTCSHGVCSEVFAPMGMECDDSNDATDFDTCNGEGACAGIDLCDNVFCETPLECKKPGVCYRGLCSFENKPIPLLGIFH